MRETWSRKALSQLGSGRNEGWVQNKEPGQKEVPASSFLHIEAGRACSAEGSHEPGARMLRNLQESMQQYLNLVLNNVYTLD